jgi:hypothetical protein
LGLRCHLNPIKGLHVGPTSNIAQIPGRLLDLRKGVGFLELLKGQVRRLGRVLKGKAPSIIPPIGHLPVTAQPDWTGESKGSSLRPLNDLPSCVSNGTPFRGPHYLTGLLSPSLNGLSPLGGRTYPPSILTDSKESASAFP